MCTRQNLRQTHRKITSSMPLLQQVSVVLWIVLTIAVVSSRSALAAPTVIDFEDLPAGTTGTMLKTHYAPNGVMLSDFSYIWHYLDIPAHSGTRVLTNINPAQEFPPPTPLTITFTSAQARVKLFAGFENSPGSPPFPGKLIAFDANGAVVAQDGPKPVAPNVLTTAFEVIDPHATPSITRVELHFDDLNYFFIDDLEFEGNLPAPVPTTAPVAQITSPINGSEVGDSTFDFAGTVTGEGLVSPVTVTTALGQPPGSHVPPRTSSLDLTGTGTTRSFFSSGQANGSYPLGPITFTVEAWNTGGLKGTASVTVSNLPLAIRNRFAAEGGAAAFGTLSFGSLGLKPGACQIAVYERGAIALSGAQTQVIRGQIFTKWLSLVSAQSRSLNVPYDTFGFMGCPLGEERDAQATYTLISKVPPPPARVQEFERGRIYANLRVLYPDPVTHLLVETSPPYTAYVPAVFVEALKQRGDEPVNGLPLADPSNSIGASQTWLFQQFFRPDHPIIHPGDLAEFKECISPTDNPNNTFELNKCICGIPPEWAHVDISCMLPSTLEIRGTPPKLWMERQGGDWVVSELEPSGSDQRGGKFAASLWESFPCSEELGTCPVGAEPQFPPQNISNAGSLVCGGNTYTPGMEFIYPGEWEAVLPKHDFTPPIFRGITPDGNYIAIPVFGAVRESHISTSDNGFTHETHYGSCPWDPLQGTWINADCGSDYNVDIRPIGPQCGAQSANAPKQCASGFPYPSLFGQDNTETLNIEYEQDYATAAHNFLGAPWTGDLIYATGRWIVDCGHDSFRTELHPLFSYARMKTAFFELNPFTGVEENLFGNLPTTRVAIWINGWYPGFNEIEFDAFPPPRPSPDAVLHVIKPLDNAPGGYREAEDVNLNYTFEPLGSANHVHLFFSSPLRENTVTYAGEMMFDSGRQYWGKWYLYWGN